MITVHNDEKTGSTAGQALRILITHGVTIVPAKVQKYTVQTSAKVVALELGVAVDTVRRWLRGGNPSAKNLARLEKWLSYQATVQPKGGWFNAEWELALMTIRRTACIDEAHTAALSEEHWRQADKFIDALLKLNPTAAALAQPLPF
jgi:hypothetical protein